MNQENKNLRDLCDNACKADGFFVTATLRDNKKVENNLQHYVIRNKFPIDDITLSIDQALSSMGIRHPKRVEVTKSPIIEHVQRPLKIAIISHFNTMPQSYSPARAVRNQIKILQEFGHTVVFFTQEGSRVDVDCEIRSIVPKFKREKNIVNDDVKQKFVDILRRELTSDFDIAISHDLYIDDCITYREAIRECGVPIPWLHFARSGVGKQIDFSMDNALYVYLNESDIGRFAKMISVEPSKVRVVFNEKDPSYLFNYHPVTSMVVNKFHLWEKDIIQTYPMCSTRMDAKGINSVIKVFGLLKEMGNKVSLIICNANGRRRVDELVNKQKLAHAYGLTEDDFVFTSLLADDTYQIQSEVPNQVASELMHLSNLFIFPTKAEVCSNVLLEASMTKNLIVLNDDLPSLFDFADKSNVLSYPFTSFNNVHYNHQNDEDFLKLAKSIHGQIHSNKADKQFRHVWRVHNRNSIYYNFLQPVLYDALKMFSKSV